MVQVIRKVSLEEFSRITNYPGQVTPEITERAWYLSEDNQVAGMIGEDIVDKIFGFLVMTRGAGGLFDQLADLQRPFLSLDAAHLGVLLSMSRIHTGIRNSVANN